MQRIEAPPQPAVALDRTAVPPRLRHVDKAVCGPAVLPLLSFRNDRGMLRYNCIWMYYSGIGMDYISSLGIIGAFVMD